MNQKEEDMEHFKAITLSSGKEFEEPKREKVDTKQLDELVEKKKGPTSLELEEIRKEVKNPILVMTL